MGQTKPAAGLKSLNRAADTLSTLLAQEVKAVSYTHLVEQVHEEEGEHHGEEVQQADTGEVGLEHLSLIHI